MEKVLLKVNGKYAEAHGMDKNKNSSVEVKTGKR